MPKNIKITLVKSMIGSCERVRRTLHGLGVIKINKSIIRKDTPEIRGMINKVHQLVKVEGFNDFSK